MPHKLIVKIQRRTVSDKILKDKTYKYAPNPQHDGCKVFDKKEDQM